MIVIGFRGGEGDAAPTTTSLIVFSRRRKYDETQVVVTSHIGKCLGDVDLGSNEIHAVPIGIGVWTRVLSEQAHVDGGRNQAIQANGGLCMRDRCKSR